MHKKIFAFLRTALIMCLVFIFPFTGNIKALAADTVNMQVDITCSYEGEVLPNVAWRVYRVAAIGDDGQAVIADEFAGSGVNLNGLDDEQSKEAAKTLEMYAKLHGVAAISQEVSDQQGKLTLNLTGKGIYLITCVPWSDDHYEYSSLPYLITVDENHNGSIVAEPKFTAVSRASDIESSKESSESKTESQGNNDSSSKSPQEDSSKTPQEDSSNNEGPLPQTGQLWWPVPVLALLGLIFVAVGTRLNRKKEHKDEK